MSSWTTDGSTGFSTSRDTVNLEPNGGVDNVFNAMWRDGDGVSSGQHYWKIHIKSLGSGVGIGITSNEHFGKGYACKSLMYCGDLNIGERYSRKPRLVADFGPKPKLGDTIGIFAVFEGARLKVYLEVNGTSLGLAFDVPAFTFESIFPMVSFYLSGSATCAKYTDIPPNITKRAPIVYPGIEGRWKLSKFGDKMFPAPVAPETLISKVATDKYKWYINKFSSNLSHENGTWKSDTLFIPGGRSRKKPREALDQTIIDLMVAVKKVEIDGSHNLSIRTDSTSSTWYRPKVTPFVGEPFGVFASSSSESSN
ncbi:hypothetical protein HA402_011623 [Bradysia odoriphaga]|nr:hypothetical protein HA402_011623 [Bradysia odoriphaga]